MQDKMAYNACSSTRMSFALQHYDATGLGYLQTEILFNFKNAIPITCKTYYRSLTYTFTRSRLNAGALTETLPTRVLPSADWLSIRNT